MFSSLSLRGSVLCHQSSGDGVYRGGGLAVWGGWGAAGDCHDAGQSLPAGSWCAPHARCRGSRSVRQRLPERGHGVWLSRAWVDGIRALDRERRGRGRPTSRASLIRNWQADEESCAASRMTLHAQDVFGSQAESSCSSITTRRMTHVHSRGSQPAAGWR